MAQSGFTPIQLYFSTTGAAVPSAGNLANGELAINITDGRLFYKDNSGTVQVLATKAGANGDVVGPASATDNALVRFDNISGKLVQNSVGILDDSGNLTGIAALTTSGALTLNGGTANGVAYLNGSKVLTTGSALTFDGTSFCLGTASPSGGYRFTQLVPASGTAVSAFRVTNGSDATFDVNLQTSLASIGTGVGDLAFLRQGSEQMRLTSTGLGIGTSSPGAKLDVKGGAVFWGVSTTSRDFEITSDASFVQLQSYNSKPLKLNAQGNNVIVESNLGLGVTPSAWSAFRAIQLQGGAVYSGATNDMRMNSNAYWNGSNFIYTTTNPATQYYQNAGLHAWFTAPSGTAGNAISFTQAMTLDASGNLALGLTSASTRLHVRAATDAANVLQIQDASVAQTLNFGVNNINGGPYVFVSTNHALRFGTNDTERARIDSSGRLLINATTAFANGQNIQVGGGALDIGTSYRALADGNWAVAFYNTATSAVGQIVINSGSTSYSSASDYRLKEDIRPMTGALAKVALLKPVTYKWKVDSSDGQGFIAHELAEVCPDAVTGEKDAVDAEGNPVYQGIDTSFLVATLTAAIQEQQAIITALTARVAALESN